MPPLLQGREDTILLFLPLWDEMGVGMLLWYNGRSKLQGEAKVWRLQVGVGVGGRVMLC